MIIIIKREITTRGGVIDNISCAINNLDAGKSPFCICLSLHFELLTVYERMHCSIVHGREIKQFSEYLDLLRRCRAARCFERGPFCHFKIFYVSIQSLEIRDQNVDLER